MHRGGASDRRGHPPSATLRTSARKRDGQRWVFGGVSRRRSGGSGQPPPAGRCDHRYAAHVHGSARARLGLRSARAGARPPWVMQRCEGSPQTTQARQGAPARVVASPMLTIRAVGCSWRVGESGQPRHAGSGLLSSSDEPATMSTMTTTNPAARFSALVQALQELRTGDESDAKLIAKADYLNRVALELRIEAPELAEQINLAIIHHNRDAPKAAMKVRTLHVK